MECDPDVLAFLKEHKLEAYAPAFAIHRVTMDALSHMRMEEIRLTLGLPFGPATLVHRLLVSYRIRARRAAREKPLARPAPAAAEGEPAPKRVRAEDVRHCTHCAGRAHHCYCWKGCVKPEGTLCTGSAHCYHCTPPRAHFSI